jgi:type IV pilus assembly protein PilC
MLFRYTAYTSDKKIVTGTIESASLEVAQESLYKSGVQRILDLKKAGRNVDLRKITFGSPRIKKQELLDFTTELTILSESGLTLLMALRQLEKQSTNSTLKNVIGQIAADLEGGTPFHEALGKHPQIFNVTYCSIIEANERAGTLDNGFRQIAKELKIQIATRAQIQRALTQPAIIVGLAFGVVLLLTLFVLPQMADIFRQFGAELPPTTRILIGFSDFMSANILYLLAGFAVLALLVYIMFRQPGTKRSLDRWMLRIPVIGTVINWNNTARFARTLSNLLNAGILLPDGMNIMLRGIGNSFYREAVAEVRKQLVQGQSFSSAMSRNKLFPPLLPEMIGVGESSGNLEHALETVADYFESKVEKRIARLTSLLEPLLIVCVGLVVGFIAISLVSTIYGMTGTMN